MSARVAKLMRIDDRRKFATLEEAAKEADRIREKIKREAEPKEYAIQMLIGISNRDGQTLKPAKPHLHIMFYACPCDAVLSMVVSYINSFEKKQGFKRAATKHGCDEDYIPYIVRQSRKFRYFEHDPDAILNDLNITEEAKKDLISFRKNPDKMSGNDCQTEQTDTMPQPMCNYRYPREGACDRRNAKGGAQGMPGRKKRNTKMIYQREAEVYSNLITRDEWLSKSTREQALYYNNLHMPINKFVWKMRLTMQRMINDFAYDRFVYDELNNEFKSDLQFNVERISYGRWKQWQKKNYINLDDLDAPPEREK